MAVKELQRPQPPSLLRDPQVKTIGDYFDAWLYREITGEEPPWLIPPRPRGEDYLATRRRGRRA